MIGFVMLACACHALYIPSLLCAYWLVRRMDHCSATVRRFANERRRPLAFLSAAMGMLAAVRAFGEVSKSQVMVGQRLQSRVPFCNDLCVVEVSSRTRQLCCITRL